MWSPQHLEVHKSAAQTAPTWATDAQRTVAYRHVLADICRAINRQRQTQRFQDNVAIMEDHVPAREQLRQPAQRLSVGLQQQSAHYFGVRRIERIVVNEEGGSVALHTPVGEDVLSRRLQRAAAQDSVNPP